MDIYSAVLANSVLFQSFVFCTLCQTVEEAEANATTSPHYYFVKIECLAECDSFVLAKVCATSNIISVQCHKFRDTLLV